MKKIRIKVENRVFDITLEEDFASFLKNELDVLSSCDIKTLLSLYFERSYEIFSTQKKLDDFIKKNLLDK
ncbi:MAG: hypothetical protein GXO31_00145 [Epsilonproteobacteria bacterium]|nr:hypothetical protein [Campylobacterota bacterium]